MDREMNKKHPQDAAGYACESMRIPSDFGFVLNRLWNGAKVFRQGWNGKGMYLALQIPDGGSKMSRPYIYMRTTNNELVPWTASQSDLLATDWEVFK